MRGSVIDSATRALRDGSRRQKGRRSGGAAGVQTVIVDVQRDPMFALHREIAAGSRFRAVQSTPLVDHNGRLLGVIETHYRRSHQSSDRELALPALYAEHSAALADRHPALGQSLESSVATHQRIADLHESVAARLRYRRADVAGRRRERRGA